MPWRLIGFILVFIVFLVFIGFNLENKCDINFGFKNLTEVPVYYTIFVSFVLGVLVTLPVALSAKKKGEVPKKKKDKISEYDEPADIAKQFDEPPPSYSGGKFFKKRKIKGEIDGKNK